VTETDGTKAGLFRMGAVRSTAKMAKIERLIQVHGFDMGTIEFVHEHLKV
jgi:hypothetical protein